MKALQITENGFYFAPKHLVPSKQFFIASRVLTVRMNSKTLNYLNEFIFTQAK